MNSSDNNSDNDQQAESKCIDSAVPCTPANEMGAADRIRQLENELLELRKEFESRNEHLKNYQQQLEKQLMECSQTEQTLKVTEQRIHSIVNTAADAIISINDTGVIEHFNLAAEKMFGYSADEAIGRNVNILMPAAYRERHNQYIARYHETNQSSVIGFTRELEARHKSGRVFPVELAISEVAPHQCYTGIIRDLSKHKALEQELLTIADQTQRLIGQNLHDDISQEMTGLSLKTEALQETVSLQDKTSQALIADIISTLERTQAKISVLSKGLIPVAVDSRGLCVALQELSHKISAAYNISCTFSCAKNLSISNNTVATQLYHIAQEAITNAIRHGHAQHIRITLSKNGSQFDLSIHDDGTGFPQSKINKTGMGLHIMQYRCKLFGGKLLIEPAKMGGVTVICSFNGDKQNGA